MAEPEPEESFIATLGIRGKPPWELWLGLIIGGGPALASRAEDWKSALGGGFLIICLLTGMATLTASSFAWAASTEALKTQRRWFARGILILGSPWWVLCLFGALKQLGGF